MKKLICLALTFIMVMSLVNVFAAEKALGAAEIAFENGTFSKTPGIRGLDRGESLGFKDVDLTGMNSLSVKIQSTLNISGPSNGDTFLIMIDSPDNGEVIGNITILPNYEEREYIQKVSIKPTNGVHDLYFYSLYGKSTENTFLRSRTI